MSEYQEVAGLFIARVFLGILFFIQGYDKVVNLGIRAVINGFRNELGDGKFSDTTIRLSAYFSSFAEFIGGALLIIGFMRYAALYALGIDLLLVAVAMGVIKPLWNMEYVLPRLLLLLFLLFYPGQNDLISLDSMLSMH